MFSSKRTLLITIMVLAAVYSVNLPAFPQNEFSAMDTYYSAISESQPGGVTAIFTRSNSEKSLESTDASKNKVTLLRGFYGSIQEAINDAEPGDTVLISGGTYEENLVIEKSLTLKGRAGEKIIIRSPKEDASAIKIGPRKVEVVLERLTVEGVENVGVHCTGKAEASVIDSELTSSSPGMVIEESAKVVVQRSVLWGNSTGLYLADSARADVLNSKIMDNGNAGVTMKDNSQVYLEKTSVRYNKHGAGLFNAAKISVSDSYISAPLLGLKFSDSSSGKVEGSNIAGCYEWAGLSLRHSSSVEVKSSEIRDNKYGIEIEHGSALTLTETQIVDNKIGLGTFYPEQFSGGIEGNGNDIHSNQVDFKNIHEGVKEELVSAPTSNGGESTSNTDKSINTKGMAKSVNDFGFSLLSTLNSKDPENNILISPIGLQLVLQLAYLGAEGKTEEEISRVLSLTEMKGEEVLERAGALLEELNNSSGGIDLSIANSVWVSEGLTFNNSFLRTVKDHYRAIIKEIDFTSPQSLNRINNWVNEETDGKITQLITDLPELTAMVLLDAIYFQGNWTSEFNKENTSEKPFYLSGGSKKSHLLMSQYGEFMYANYENIQLIRLPYGERENLAAYIVLPDKESGVNKTLSNLSEKKWRGWLNGLKEREGLVELPRFSIKYEKTLNKPLQRLGIDLAFDSGKADFSGLLEVSDENLYLGEVKHKTFLQVNEKGTKAAAATSARMDLTATRSEEKPFEMVVNRPFIFSVVDEASGTLLFIGIIAEPESLD